MPKIHERVGTKNFMRSKTKPFINSNQTKVKTMKTIFTCIILCGIFNLKTINAQEKPLSTKEVSEKWKFIQSDKPMQYRFKKEKQNGDTLFLKMQFRLNKTDKIFCKEAACLGYNWFFNFNNGLVAIDNHYTVLNSFESIYELKETIVLVLIKDQYGEQNWDEESKSIVYKSYNSGEIRPLSIGWSCVDNYMENSASTRCSYFDSKKAQILK